MRAFLLSFLLVVIAVPAMAQDTLPSIPEPLQPLVDKGAQIRFLGKSHGLDGWIMIYKGQEQYFYVLPDGKAFLTGLLFDNDGTAITVKQVQDLQKQGDDVLDLMAETPKTDEDVQRPQVDADKPFEYQKPVDRMFADVQNSNWIVLGKKEAPVIYSFVDPQCPHCHEFIKGLKDKGYLDAGRIQVRAIPVGFREDTLAQAAFLLAAGDAQERYYKFLDGDKTVLPAKYDINNQGVQKNLALMQAWNFDVTPFTLYRSKGGEVKIVRGVPKDVDSILNDLE
jgi:thiol:disulfide interchange protein DsbG